MLRKSFTLLAATALLVALAATTAFAQVTAGAVTGTVTDTNGAIVPGATVTLRSGSTGQTFTAQTTGAGSYSFPNVPVGDYTLTVEMTDYAPASQELRVSLNQTTTVDVRLGAGQVSGGIVVVTAASEALVQPDTSQLGRSYETRLVQNLPIFGTPNALALLSPNVVGQSSGTAGSGGSVGGVRPRYNVFTVDGVDNNEPSVTGPATGVIQDAVAEFTLLTNSFNAEFGQGGGGQFITITRSGTNEFHGSAFVYLQNQRLNAASTNEEAQLQAGLITELPRSRSTRYGGTFGGPIIRDRLFFFGAVERNPFAAEGASTAYLAPTSAGLAQIATLPGASQFVINLLRNNLALAPAQTTTETVLGTAGIPFGTVILNIPSGANNDSFQSNIDWNPNERNQFRFRFSYNDFVGVDPVLSVGYGNTNFNSPLTFQTRLFSATYIRTFSSNLVNEMRLSYRRTLTDYVLEDPSLENFPNLTVTPLNLALGPNENLPQGGFDNQYQVYNTLSYIRGRHSFKFGVDYRNLIFTSFFLPRGRGDYVYTTFDELIQDLPPTSVDLRGVGSGGFTGNNQRYYFFAQDDFKVTPNLTLNLGLRYEYVTLPRDAQLQALNQIASIPGIIEFRVPQTDRNNFAPRAGIAYAPEGEGGIGGLLFGRRGQSSIRANFSMSYSETFQNLILLQLPPQFQQENDVATVEQAFGLNLQTRFLEQGGIPSTPIPPTSVAAARAATGSFITDQRFGEIYSFSLSYQRELTPTMAIELRYLGTRGRHLPVQFRRGGAYTNPAALTLPTFIGAQPTAAQLAGQPTLGDIQSRPDVTAFPLDSITGPAAAFGGFLTSFEAMGSSQYDAGSISLQRRFSQGFAFTAAYTWSKTIANSDNELFTSVANPRRPEDQFNLSNERSVSTFDIPHRFVFAANFEPRYFNDRGGLWRALFGDFVFSPIFQAQSGQPVTPLAGLDANMNFDAAGDRAIFNPNGAPGTGSGVTAVAVVGGAVTEVPLGDPRTQGYVAINPNAQYIQTGFGARSTAGRNTLRTNGFNRTDLTILRNIRFGEERYNLQIGAEIFNLWNQRIRTIGGGGSGDTAVNTNTGVGALSTAFVNTASTFFNNYSIGNFSGRTIQLRAKFIF